MRNTRQPYGYEVALVYTTGLFVTHNNEQLLGELVTRTQGQMSQDKTRDTESTNILPRILVGATLPLRV